MKKIHFLLLILFGISFFSCTSYLTPNMTGDNNISYLPRPLNVEEKKSKIYVSGDYVYSASDGYLEMKSGIVNASKGHTLKNINFAYGVFGFFGNASYQDTTASGRSSKTIENFNKSFYGFGLRSTVGLHYNKNDFTFRYINWENAFSTELGNYAEYRKFIYDLQRSNGKETVYVSKQTILFTTGLSSEVVWNNVFDDDNSQFGFRAFFGITPNLRNNFKQVNNQTTNPIGDKIAVNVSTFIKVKRIFSNIQLGSEINTSLKFCLGYTF